MAYANTTFADRPTRIEGMPLAHLMPLGAEAQVFCALLPDEADSEIVEIMNTRFAGRGKNAAWLPIHAAADDLHNTLDTLKLFGNLAGFSAHSRFQKLLAERLDTLSPRGRLAGLADVARRMPDGSWEGDLAALDAFRRTMRAEGVDPRGARVWLIGAEGNAVAAALCLAERGISALTVVDEHDAALTLASRVRAAFPRVSVSIGIPDARSIDIVVDGVSMAATQNLLAATDPNPLRPDTLVISAIARQRMGSFTERCAKAGLPVVAGDCLLEHLLTSFEEFFGWSRIPYKDAVLRNPHSASVS